MPVVRITLQLFGAPEEYRYQTEIRLEQTVDLAHQTPESAIARLAFDLGARFKDTEYIIAHAGLVYQ